jgi:hypothetical protein
MVISTGTFRPKDYSGNTSNFVWGPQNSPQSIGIGNALLFGAAAMYDDGYNSTLAMRIRGHDGLAVSSIGSNESVYGRYGHLGLNVGELVSTSGINDRGSISAMALPDPPPPNVNIKGSPGTQKAAYAVVCHDRNGGVTLASKFTTINRSPNVLSRRAYLIVSWPARDGCFQWDILKNNYNTALATMQNPPVQGIGHILSIKDVGQNLSVYRPVERNTTADLTSAGMTISKGITWPLPVRALNGASFYCPNCDAPIYPATTCSSDGNRTGAWAHGLNNRWICVP